ncbi:hypothetical protein WJT86_01840 [Microvirga sp. W0021]|uniref:Uncharacterized protein n=1 Tax=Hohaiivirga grylli TaxID=3133970 RepID=A0ABV0BHN8_9HYPH
MIRWLIVSVLLVLSSVASAEAVYPAGSRIGLQPPGEMQLSNRFSGFENEELQTSITFVELPATAYSQAMSDLTKAGLKRQGLRENVRQNFKVNGEDALLVGGQQTVSGQKIRKWIVVLGDSTMTGFVIAQAPVDKKGFSDADMIAALKTVALRAPLSLQQQAESLPFTIGDLAGFRIVRVISGNSIILTEGPKDNNLDGEQPVIVIGVSMGAPAADPNARDSFARELLASSQNLRNIFYERSENFRFKGDDWHEIVARAVDTLSARQVTVLQSIRFRGGGYIRMLAMVKSENRTGTLSRFLTLINSVEFKE